MAVTQVTSRSPAETRKLGKDLSETLERGDIVALTGALGSGKTCLTQGICEGLHVDDPVTSPTFVLVNEYRGQDRDGEVTVYHFDLYRLEGADDLVDLGWDDYLDEGGICLVEWADRAEDVIPSRAVRIAIEAPDRCVRLLTLTRED